MKFAAKFPKNVAIIMDGNGRWAQLRSKPRTYGHVKGTRVAKKIITECSKLGIESLTLYAFSSENWLRPASEVDVLMKILKRYLRRETQNLIKENIRFTTIGDTSRLPLDVRKAVAEASLPTAQCTGLHLVFAISYGSQQEIVEAVKTIAAKIKSDELTLDMIDESTIAESLQTAGTPNPDLIIRTSGEQRLSNFLLWQAAYSEFYFSSILWPDFTSQDLMVAFADYSKRQRRFGKVEVSDEELHH